MPTNHCSTKRCRKCKNGPCKSRKFSVARDLKLLCACCQRAWSYELAVLLRNEFSSSAPTGSHDSQLTDLTTLERIIARAGLWERRAWIVYTVGNTGSHREAAEVCRRRWRRAPFIWNRDKVRELATEARGRIDRHLKWAGLLESSVYSPVGR